MTSSPHMGTLTVWDIQTGVIILGNVAVDSSEIMFHGDGRAVTIDQSDQHHTLDVLSGKSLCRVDVLPSMLGAHWTHKNSLQFATYTEVDAEHTIHIYELQPTSAPPLHILSSFPVPPHDGGFSFSPVSFHASFSTETEVTILDVQDSKVLL